MSNAEMGAKLRELRGQKSREEVASAIGVSISAIQMYENGGRVPRDETKKKLAELYGVTVQDLFFAV